LECKVFDQNILKLLYYIERFESLIIFVGKINYRGTKREPSVRTRFVAQTSCAGEPEKTRIISRISIGRNVSLLLQSQCYLKNNVQLKHFIRN
jgi:hypothetical protein